MKASRNGRTDTATTLLYELVEKLKELMRRGKALPLNEGRVFVEMFGRVLATAAGTVRKARFPEKAEDIRILISMLPEEEQRRYSDHIYDRIIAPLGLAVVEWTDELDREKRGPRDVDVLAIGLRAVRLRRIAEAHERRVPKKDPNKQAVADEARQLMQTNEWSVNKTWKHLRTRIPELKSARQLSNWLTRYPRVSHTVP